VRREAQATPQAVLSLREWELAFELGRSLKIQVELAVSLPRWKSGLTEVLSVWAIALGVLGIEVYLGVLFELQAGRIRSAFILSRSLLDYAIRLHFYITQARVVESEYEAAGSPRNRYRRYLNRIKAYADAHTGVERWLDVTGFSEEDLDQRFSPEQRREVIRRLKRLDVAKKRSFWEMLDEVSEGDRAFRAANISEHQLRSMFAHGDQAVIADALTIGPDTMDVHWVSTKVPSYVILRDAIAWTLVLMRGIGIVSNHWYGVIRGSRLFEELFTEGEALLFGDVNRDLA
jgi:hypothetical protein